ncbi:MAG: hypothetical protein ACE5NG_08840 [bacterium]
MRLQLVVDPVRYLLSHGVEQARALFGNSIGDFLTKIREFRGREEGLVEFGKSWI